MFVDKTIIAVFYVHIQIGELLCFVGKHSLHKFLVICKMHFNLYPTNYLEKCYIRGNYLYCFHKLCGEALIL